MSILEYAKSAVYTAASAVTAGTADYEQKLSAGLTTTATALKYAPSAAYTAASSVAADYGQKLSASLPTVTYRQKLLAGLTTVTALASAISAVYTAEDEEGIVDNTVVGTIGDILGGVVAFSAGTVVNTAVNYFSADSEDSDNTFPEPAEPSYSSSEYRNLQISKADINLVQDNPTFPVSDALVRGRSRYGRSTQAESTMLQNIKSEGQILLNTIFKSTSVAAPAVVLAVDEGDHAWEDNSSDKNNLADYLQGYDSADESNEDAAPKRTSSRPT